MPALPGETVPQQGTLSYDRAVGSTMRVLMTRKAK